MKGRRKQGLQVVVMLLLRGVWGVCQFLATVVDRLLRGLLRTAYLPGAMVVCSGAAYLLADRLAPTW
jgi:hypothetical protein